MKRRDALKSIGFAAFGLAVLPSCAGNWFNDDIPVDSTFSSKEQEILSVVADTIIPEKDSVGAIPQGVDKFLIRLFDECYEEEVQDNIKQQLIELNELASHKFGSPFKSCVQSQREELLLSFDQAEDDAKNRFFQLLKNETIRGFRTSRVVMQDFYNYKVVPGFYNGNVDVEA